jgi:hypothetical protein
VNTQRMEGEMNRGGGVRGSSSTQVNTGEREGGRREE